MNIFNFRDGCIKKKGLKNKKLGSNCLALEFFFFFLYTLFGNLTSIFGIVEPNNLMIQKNFF